MGVDLGHAEDSSVFAVYLGDKLVGHWKFTADEVQKMQDELFEKFKNTIFTVDKDSE